MKRTLLSIGLLLLYLGGIGMAQGEKKVDLNQADLSELTSLPGIGPAIAKRIIEYREKNGGFKEVDELLNIRGIGDKKFSKIEDRVVAAPPAPAQPPPR